MQSALKPAVIGAAGDHLQNTWLTFRKGTCVMQVCYETSYQVRFVSVTGLESWFYFGNSAAVSNNNFNACVS
jgi:hypothetical protein